MHDFQRLCKTHRIGYVCVRLPDPPEVLRQDHALMQPPGLQKSCENGVCFRKIFRGCGGHVRIGCAFNGLRTPPKLCEKIVFSLDLWSLWKSCENGGGWVLCGFWRLWQVILQSCFKNKGLMQPRAASGRPQGPANRILPESKQHATDCEDPTYNGTIYF